MSVFLDTNILLYAISPLPKEQYKRDIAVTLIDHGDCALSVLVFNEFVHQSTRPTRPRPLSRNEALGFVAVWRRFPVASLDFALFDRAADIARRTQYNWWDSLIVATAVMMDCRTLATEDLQHGRVIDGVRIENPFRDVA